MTVVGDFVEVTVWVRVVVADSVFVFVVVSGGGGAVEPVASDSEPLVLVLSCVFVVAVVAEVVDPVCSPAVFVVEDVDLSVALAIVGTVPVTLRVLVRLALTLPDRLFTAPEPHAATARAHPKPAAQTSARMKLDGRLNLRPAPPPRGTSASP